MNTIRREAAVEAKSGIDIGGTAAETGNWALEEGDAVSTEAIALSLPSGPIFAVTGNSGSWAAWRQIAMLRPIATGKKICILKSKHYTNLINDA